MRPRSTKAAPCQGAALDLTPNSANDANTTVPRRADSVQEELPLRRYPAAYGSVWTPTRHRRWWTVIYRCPHCEEHHHGRSPRRITSGVRHARCGRLIWLVIMRVYRGKAVELGGDHR